MTDCRASGVGNSDVSPTRSQLGHRLSEPGARHCARSEGLRAALTRSHLAPRKSRCYRTVTGPRSPPSAPSHGGLVSSHAHRIRLAGPAGARAADKSMRWLNLKGSIGAPPSPVSSLLACLPAASALPTAPSTTHSRACTMRVSNSESAKASIASVGNAIARQGFKLLRPGPMSTRAHPPGPPGP
jgi:hypothetical protein